MRDGHLGFEQSAIVNDVCVGIRVDIDPVDVPSSNMGIYDQGIRIGYLDKRVVVVLDETAGGMVYLINLTHITTSGGSAFQLCYDVDAPN